MDKKLKFAKYSGNGNDFIILDNTQVSLTPALVQKMCDRHFGIGADGVLILTDHSEADGKMSIFNADGGEAEMCGNGLRCLVTYMDQHSDKKKDSYLIKTMHGLYTVKRLGNSFAINMSEIKDKNLYDFSQVKDFEKSFFINTGVPHLVFLTKDAKKISIKEMGAKYRFHTAFPNGSNVNFVEKLSDPQSAYVRTYERGVEDETHSCGTGLTATGLALSEWFGWKGDIHLFTKGGKQTVNVDKHIYYSGEVTFCFAGEFPL